MNPAGFGETAMEGSSVPMFRQDPVVDRLHAVDHFRDCKKAQLRLVARLTDQVKIGAGKAVVKEGEYGNEVFLILAGTAGATREGRPINALGSGDFFGELAVLKPGTRNATVTALSDLDLLVIGRREFNAMLQIPGFRDALLTSMASRLQAVDAQLATALEASPARQVALMP